MQDERLPEWQTHLWEAAQHITRCHGCEVPTPETELYGDRPTGPHMSEDEDHSPLDVLSAATSVVQPAALAAADDVQEPTTCSDAARIEMLHMVRGWRCLTSDMLVRNITFPELTARASRLKARAERDGMTAEAIVRALLTE